MNKKLIIFDMDGTIYLGKDLFDGALETFDYLKKHNIEYLAYWNLPSANGRSFFCKEKVICHRFSCFLFLLSSSYFFFEVIDNGRS